LKRKSLDEFKPRPNGTVSYCYKCEIGYYREYNAKRYASPEARAAELKRTKERYHAVRKPLRHMRKLELIALMGGKCQRCGYAKSVAALDFHHRKPVDKKRTISHLLPINQPWAWEALLKEVKKCDLICSNCHRELTYPGWEIFHLPKIDF
jgi:hypothetical protein